MGSKPDLGGYAGRFFLMGRVSKGKRSWSDRDTGHMMSMMHMSVAYWKKIQSYTAIFLIQNSWAV